MTPRLLRKCSQTNLVRFARWLGLRIEEGEHISPDYIAECLAAPFDPNNDARKAIDRLQAKGKMSRVMRY